MRKNFTLKNSGSKINPSGYGWKFLYIWIISEICPTLKAIFIELLSEEMYVAWNSYGSYFFFQLRYRSLGLHCFSGVIVRQIIPWLFFFSTEIWSNRRACDYKDGIKKCSSGI